MLGMGGVPLAALLVFEKANPQPDGTVTLTVKLPTKLKRQDGSPAQAGDVVSVQPGGALQTRPEGAAGAWERACVQGSLVVFKTEGPGGPEAYAFAFAEKLPE